MEETKEKTVDSTVTLIQKWIDETRPFYGDYVKVVEKNVQYYLGDQTDVARVRGKKSKSVENRVFSAVETIVPIVTSTPPSMVVKPAKDDEQAEIRAAKLQKSLEYHYERLNLRDKLERYTRNLIVKRVGVFKLAWNEKEDDFDVKVVNPVKLRIPRKGSSVDEIPYILEEVEMSYSSLEEFFGKEKAEKVKNSGGETTETSEENRKKNVYTVWEATTDDWTAWMCKGEILDKKDNQFYDKADASKNFFGFSKKHYVIKSLFPLDDYLIGETDLIQQTIPIQDNINKRKRQIEDLCALVANPPLLIDSDTMDEETASTITNEEGLIIYGKDVAGQGKIRFETPGQVPQYLFSDLINSRSEFDNVFGTHSTTRGEKSSSPTLGQDMLQRQGDLGRIDLISRKIEGTIAELANWFVQIMKQHYSDDKKIMVFGDDGRDLVEFSRADIEDGVEIIVKSGFVLPMDEVSQRKEAINLFQLGALEPLSLYEKMKFPNPTKTFERLAKFRSGQMFQEYSGQGAQPAQSGVPGQLQTGQQAGAGGVSNQQEAIEGRQQPMGGIMST